jgi:hypothetical protein
MPFFNLNDLMTSLISFGVVVGKVCCESMGAAILFSISWSLSSLCGANISAKCCGKSSDFSLFLLAQGPVVDVVRAGDEDSLGFLCF